MISSRRENRDGNIFIKMMIADWSSVFPGIENIKYNPDNYE